jgi:hypothetical protein
MQQLYHHTHMQPVTTQIHVVSASALTLPLLVEDASRPVTEGDEEGSVQPTSTSTSEADGASTSTHVGPRVSASTALDYRWIDLRTPANQVQTRGAASCLVCSAQCERSACLQVFARTLLQHEQALTASELRQRLRMFHMRVQHKHAACAAFCISEQAAAHLCMRGTGHLCM